MVKVYLKDRSYMDTHICEPATDCFGNEVEYYSKDGSFKYTNANYHPKSNPIHTANTPFFVGKPKNQEPRVYCKPTEKIVSSFLRAGAAVALPFVAHHFNTLRYVSGFARSLVGGFAPRYVDTLVEWASIACAATVIYKMSKSLYKSAPNKLVARTCAVLGAGLALLYAYDYLQHPALSRNKTTPRSNVPPIEAPHQQDRFASATRNSITYVAKGKEVKVPRVSSGKLSGGIHPL